MFGCHVIEPAPWGPQRELRALQVFEGGASGSPARWMMVEGESRTARHARFVSADLDPSQDRPPAITGVRDLRRDRASLPHLRRLASAPLDRTRMNHGIAELRNLVKNKIGTLPRLSPRHGRAGPGHPDAKSAALHAIGITGTRPVMTKRVAGPGEGLNRKGVIPGRSVAEGKGNPSTRPAISIPLPSPAAWPEEDTQRREFKPQGSARTDTRSR